jgi:hypothetical protein
VSDAAIAAGTTIATESGGVGLVAGTGAAAGSSLSASTLLSGASAAATGVSALSTLAAGSRGINVPPAPQSTTGTAGGQAGAVLNPSTLSTKTLLGG